MHTEANLTLLQKGQMSMYMYNYHFSNSGRPTIPDDLCKGSATRHPRFWRRRFLKVFNIYGHGSHRFHTRIFFSFATIFADLIFFLCHFL